LKGDAIPRAVSRWRTALSLALGTIYITKGMMRSTDEVFLAFFWGEIDRPECGVGLIAVK
jgi:hypothetical protein